MSNRISAPDFVVSLVTEWLAWWEEDIGSNPLSYPSETMEYRLLHSPGRGGGSGGRSRVPSRQMPSRLALVDRAMKMMPLPMAQAVLYRQLKDIPGFCTATGLSTPQCYKLADQGYWFINGLVQATVDLRG